MSRHVASHIPPDQFEQARRSALSFTRSFARRLPSWADRGSLEGEALLAVCEAARKWTGSGSFADFAFACVNNQVRDEFRKQRRRQFYRRSYCESLILSLDADVADECPDQDCEMPAAPDDPEAEAIAAVSGEILWQAVRGLPYPLPQLIGRMFRDDAEPKAVAREMGIGKSQMYRLRRLALERLREAIS